jgi:threonyl-tRNA synthetase
MDLVSKDSLGREWQISTIQLDFIMPQRFKLAYIDSDGKEKTPVMIHRAIIGSPERFM